MTGTFYSLDKAAPEQITRKNSYYDNQSSWPNLQNTLKFRWKVLFRFSKQKT